MTGPVVAGPDGGHSPTAAGQPDGAKLAAARLWAVHRHPYLASAVFAAPVVPAPGLGRIAIDRWWRIHADPVTVQQVSVDQLGGELLHLCSHLLRAHAERAGGVTLTGPAEVHHWVDAADAEINDDFPDLPRVSAPISPADLDCPPGRLAEEYYRRGSVRPDGSNDCGSGAHGQPSFDQPPPDEGRSARGLSQQEQEMLRRRVADDIARAADAEVPPGLRTWAEAHRQPRVDWRRELAAELRRALGSIGGAVDYSYRRPSRRATIAAGVVLPALRRPSVEVAVVCDTSASVSEPQLAAAVAEVDGVLRAAGTRSVRLLACDDAVRTCTRVTGRNDVTLIGGGGTDMGAGLAATAALLPRPQLVVVITDGFTPWPPLAPPARVVVGVLAPDPALGGARPPDPPSWARTVTIDWQDHSVSAHR